MPPCCEEIHLRKDPGYTVTAPAWYFGRHSSRESTANQNKEFLQAANHVSVSPVRFHCMQGFLDLRREIDKTSCSCCSIQISITL